MVNKFSDYLCEALDPTEWLNLHTDTTNASEVPDSGFGEASEAIRKMLDDEPADNVIFISPDIQLGKDFTSFIKDIVPQSKEAGRAVINDGTTVRYLTKYEHNGIPFVAAEFRDQYEYPFFYISKECFDQLNQAIYPNEAGEIIPAAGEGVQVDDGLADLQEPGPGPEEEGQGLDADLDMQGQEGLSLDEEPAQGQEVQAVDMPDETTGPDEDEEGDNAKKGSLLK